MIWEWLNAVIEYFSGFWGRLELVATITLIINVYLLAKQDIRNYYFGGVGVLIYGWIFLEYKLYSDMLLQWLYYLPLQAVGYYWWKTKGPGDNDLPIVSLPSEDRVVWVFGILSGTFALGYAMATWTDASFPYWDAFTTVMSLVAQYFLIKKIWENWVLWIVMDVVAIFVYYAKDLYVTSGLYVIFLGLATFGLFKWIEDYRNQGEKSLLTKSSFGR